MVQVVATCVLGADVPHPQLQSDDSIADNLISRADYDEFCKSEGDH